MMSSQQARPYSFEFQVERLDSLYATPATAPAAASHPAAKSTLPPYADAFRMLSSRTKLARTHQLYM